MVCERLRCRGFYSCCGRYLSNRQVTGYVFRNALACRFQLEGEWQAAVFSPCVPCHAGGFIRMSSARRSPARIEFMRAHKTARAAPDQFWGSGIDATRERHHAGTVRRVENDSPSAVPMTDVPENNDAHHEVTHPACVVVVVVRFVFNVAQSVGARRMRRARPCQRGRPNGRSGDGQHAIPDARGSRLDRRQLRELP